jgi:hypothetical protein
MRIAAIALLALLVSQDPGKRFEDREYGFRIERPDDDWGIRKSPNPPGAELAVKVFRRATTAEINVTVYVSKAKTPDAESHCDRAEKRFSTLKNLKRGTSTVSDRKTPWLAFDYTAQGKTYRLQQHYLVRGEWAFTIQRTAPKEEFENYRKAFDGIVGTFTLIKANDASLKRLADRCGSEVEWAKDWDEASKKARREKRLVLVVAELYGGFDVPRRAPSTTFMDPDVIELVRERFVLLRWDYGTRLPLQDPKVYGAGGSTFGGGMLFVTPDSEVVGECVGWNPWFLYSRACTVLRRHFGKPKARSAASHIKRGELEAAWALLKEPKTRAQWKLRADLLRRLRLGEEALAALSRSGGDDLMQAEILVRMGRFKEAEKILDSYPDDPEALYRTGEAWLGMKKSPRPCWEELTESHPESRWAWKAAANMNKQGVALGQEAMKWPPEGIIERLAYSPPKVVGREKAERDALRFLKSSQCKDGSFTCIHHIVGRPSGFGAAITSISAMSLIRFEADRKAVERALGHVLDLLGKGVLDAKGSLFDNAIWGQIFTLRFLARCVEEEIGERRTLVAAMNRILGEMEKDQGKGGGWAYVQGKDTIGFVTAAAILILLEAREAGASVPEAMLSRALDGIEQLRHPSGTFGYMHSSGRGSEARQAEASLRSPLYAYALHKAGRGKTDAIVKALDIYLKHRLHTRKEFGKTLCHTGQEGTASYYLLYGYAFMAEALQVLPEAKRGRYREALLDDTLSARRVDGSFLGNPLVGRSYGTAMALRIFDYLR